MKVTNDHFMALKKLIGNSGIRFNEAIHLTQKNFDFPNKLILVESSNKSRYATILPNDVNWFKSWFKTFTGGLFPFTNTIILKQLEISSFSLRKELAQRMWNVGCDKNLICFKLGRIIIDSKSDNRTFLNNLIKWESKNSVLTFN